MPIEDNTQKYKARPRRNFLINPSFQLTFLAVTGGLAFVLISLQFGVNYYFFLKFEKLGRALMLPPSHVIFQFMGYQKRTMFVLFGLSSAFILTFLLTYGLIWSHRIAGPLYRLCTHLMRDANSGTLSPVQFRKKDLFKEVADSYNKLVTSHHRAPLTESHSERNTPS